MVHLVIVIAWTPGDDPRIGSLNKWKAIRFGRLPGKGSV